MDLSWQTYLSKNDLTASADSSNQRQNNPLSTAQPGILLISMEDSNRASAVEGAAHKWLMHAKKNYTYIYCLT